MGDLGFLIRLFNPYIPVFFDKSLPLLREKPIYKHGNILVFVICSVNSKEFCDNGISTVLNIFGGGGNTVHR